jgi:aspartyl-tRNA(Asn)/glutamyl-tRNA(Gln) amidotransferase subunit B
MGDVRAWLNENGLTMNDFPVAAERLAELVQLIDGGKVSHTIASQKLFPLMLVTPTVSVVELATKNDLLQDNDEGLIDRIMKDAMTAYPDKVEAYRKGNKGLLGLFMGEVMKGTKGKADPKRANEVVRRLLDNDNA